MINRHSALALTHPFLAHKRLWAAGLLSTWLVVNALILATSTLLEDGRDGLLRFQVWEPFCWQLTSAAVLLALFPAVVAMADAIGRARSWTALLAYHLAASVAFSAIHVAAMVALRKLCYMAMGSDYRFGNLIYEWGYEYRKDLQTYVLLLALIYGFRFIVRRLQGEASLIAEGEAPPPAQSPPERLLVKKLGKEFLINVRDIEWVEAAGNYANLHIDGGIYPMRVTMNKLTELLPHQQFARIHRSTIVNLKYIKTLQPLDTGDYTITLLTGQTLSLSRRYREPFKDRLRTT